MLKRLTSHVLFFIRRLNRKPLDVTVIRRYGITSGSVGELYVHGTYLCDTLDTFDIEHSDTMRTTTAIYDDFYHLRLADKLVMNNVELANKEMRIKFINRWVAEW